MTGIVDPPSKKLFCKKLLTDVRYEILLRVQNFFVRAKLKCVDKFLSHKIYLKVYLSIKNILCVAQREVAHLAFDCDTGLIENTLRNRIRKYIDLYSGCVVICDEHERLITK